MDFIFWHYTAGVEYYLKNFLIFITDTKNYFSFGLLLKTLFLPWKRTVDTDTSPGFNLQRWFTNFSNNAISRGVGAVVRFTLFWVGIVVLFFAFIGGVVGLLFWLLLPFVSIPVYKKSNISSRNILERLKNNSSDSKEFITNLMHTNVGFYVANHVGLNTASFVEGASGEFDKSEITKRSFEELFKYLEERNVWNNEYFAKLDVDIKDFKIAASLFDRLTENLGIKNKNLSKRPGIGLELIFGYTPTLNKYSIDMSKTDFAHHLIGRESVVSQIERYLSGKKGVAVLGLPGVGKKTVIYEFARRAANGELGLNMSYKRVLDFDYNAILSESTDVNMKKNILSHVFSEAANAGNVILVVKDIQRLTNSEVEGFDFTDIFEKHLEKGKLLLIALTTPNEYERFISRNARLRKYLERLEVLEPPPSEAFEILLEASLDWEFSKNITFTIASLRNILESSEKYISDTPFPEKSLELLDSIVAYAEKNSVKVITKEVANTVIEEKTGIPLVDITDTQKKKLQNLEEIIHQNLINQNTAVSLIAKSLRSKSLAGTDSKRPVGSFLFLGPTGVGKTETAKVLARTYFGTEDAILRFDMAEYAGAEGFERLIGSTSKNMPGALATAIKNKPASLLLLDEIEKATPQIFNLFLTLLDEGEFKDAFGKTVICRNLFIIATSNAGAEFIRKLVSANIKPDDLQKQVLTFVLEDNIFSPEFINRFDGVVVYEPLSEENLIKVSTLILEKLQKNLKLKNINLLVTQNAAAKLARDGYEPEFGARPLRKIVDLYIGDAIGKKILSGEIMPGATVEIIPLEGKNEYDINVT